MRLYNHALPTDSIPDTLRVRNYDNQLNHFNYLLLPISKNAKPNYIKFYLNENDNNSLLDVIAFKIDSSDYNKIQYNTILDSSSMKAPLYLTPGDELFVVGFPRDYGYTNVYPIWKRGTIASEPKFETFLIDATTRGGMSGSPVYFKNNSYFESPGGYNTGSYTLVKLIGIYSAQSYETELGNIIDLEPILNKLLKSN